MDQRSPLYFKYSYVSQPIVPNDIISDLSASQRKWNSFQCTSDINSGNCFNVLVTSTVVWVKVREMKLFAMH